MLELKKVSKHFGSVAALVELDLLARPGEILGLLGPNGAGKTTTMKTIAGFWYPSSGQILLDGLDIAIKPEAAKRRVGYLQENVALYDDMKVFEYLKFMAEMRDLLPEHQLERIKEVAERCGLNKVIGRPIAHLSKGFKQRIGLAQAILHDPEVLILDEPTAGLDPNQIVEIRGLIKEIGATKIMIFSTHILAEAAAICDRIVIINQGLKVAEGTPDELACLTASQQYYLEVAAEPSLVAECLASYGLTAEQEDPQLAAYKIIFKNKEQRLQLAAALARAGLPVVEFAPQNHGLEDSFRQLTQNI
ncbi:MAG: ABC transporter ATP-binding protein [Candidatus Falkowbacteria bacterium]